MKHLIDADSLKADPQHFPDSPRVTFSGKLGVKLTQQGPIDISGDTCSEDFNFTFRNKLLSQIKTQASLKARRNRLDVFKGIQAL